MYANADWMGDPCGNISTSGYILLLGPNPICWYSRKQQSVDRSFTKAEQELVANVLSEITWVQNLLNESYDNNLTNAKHFCGNIGISYLSKNSVFYTKMKHNVVDYHYLRNSVKIRNSDCQISSCRGSNCRHSHKIGAQACLSSVLSKLVVVAPHLT